MPALEWPEPPQAPLPDPLPHEPPYEVARPLRVLEAEPHPPLPPLRHVTVPRAPVPRPEQVVLPQVEKPPKVVEAGELVLGLDARCRPRVLVTAAATLGLARPRPLLLLPLPAPLAAPFGPRAFVHRLLPLLALWLVVPLLVDTLEQVVRDVAPEEPDAQPLLDAVDALAPQARPRALELVVRWAAQLPARPLRQRKPVEMAVTKRPLVPKQLPAPWEPLLW